MVRGIKLSEFEKGRISALRNQQWSLRRIANEIGRSHHVVHNFLVDPNAYGTKKSSGRPKATDDRTRRRIVSAASNSTASSSQLVGDSGLNCSPLTVRRVLHDSGVIVRGKMAKCPNLTAGHKAARLAFAEEKLTQQIDWTKIIWSDEKKFNLDGPDGFCGYWHDLRKEPRYFSRRNFGGGTVMVWGAFEKTGTLPLAFTSSKMNSKDYQHVLQEHLTLFWQPDYLFMQDNAPIHRSASTMEYMAHHGIAVLDWPACSPDLNPIENLWGIMVRDVYQNNRQYATVSELKTSILEAWGRLNLRTLDNLCRSLPNRLIDVVKCKGGPTKY